jgi:predicted ATPase
MLAAAALTPLVGREEELDLLLRRWSQARDGEGQVVLLSGEPGIGKSRLLNALRERQEAQGAQSLRFQCSPYYVNSAFWPIIDNFERTLKFARDELAEAKLDKLEALVVTHYGRPLADVRFVAAILSIPCEQRYGALPMTPQKHKDETLRTLVDITEAAARRQPSVMLFEDAHWADPTTLEVLDLLRPGEDGSPAGGAHPPAGVSVALVRARPCRCAEPVQADPGAECCDGRHAGGQGAA